VRGARRGAGRGARRGAVRGARRGAVRGARRGAVRGARRGGRHLRKDLWQQSRLGEVRHVLLLLGRLQLLLERLERERAERQDVQAPAADARRCVCGSLAEGGRARRGAR
jgi:hypothetical protein